MSFCDGGGSVPRDPLMGCASTRLAGQRLSTDASSSLSAGETALPGAGRRSCGIDPPPRISHVNKTTADFYWLKRVIVKS